MLPLAHCMGCSALALISPGPGAVLACGASFKSVRLPRGRGRRWVPGGMMAAGRRSSLERSTAPTLAAEPKASWARGADGIAAAVSALLL